MWKTDKEGKIINTAEDMNNHLMDALRYGLEGHIKNFDKNVGLVDATPRPDKIESFVVNKQGDAEAFHIDLGALAKKNQEEDWYL